MTDGPLIVAAVALLDGNNRVLVQQRAAGKAHGGLWEFPGGKLEAGETPAAALVRELAEELAIVVTPDDLTPLAFGTDAAGARSLLLLLFTARRWRGEPRAVEAAALRWATLAALAELPMPPADRPLVTALQRLLRDGTPG